MYIYSRMTDEEIVALAKQGDESAFTEIFDRYKRIVRLNAGAYFIEGGEPDDIIQEGMIGLFQAVRDYDAQNSAGASFNTFARLCIVRQISSAIRIASAKKNSPLNSSVSIREEDEQDTNEFAESPESILIDRETAASMENRLKGLLSEFEKEVLDKMLKDMSYREISEALQVDRKSVDNAIQRIKRKMKKIKNA